MDLRSLNQSIDYFGCCGFVVGPEQRAALQNSLVILRKNQKFCRVEFWGKIIGDDDDYCIARGFVDDCLSKKKILYSKNCVHWGLLNEPTDEMLRKSRLITSRFTGHPNHEVEQTVKIQNTDGDGYTEETIVLKEEDRLAAVISDIENDVFIVPRGAFVKSPDGLVLPNRMFEGLSEAEADKLYNYHHHRRAERPHETTRLDRADYERSIDFMDSIHDDLPRGAWSVQEQKVGGYVVLRSLLWIGYNFYHVPHTQHFGSVYIGTGVKNLDLPFML